jgi:uncharacterized protein YdeI (YjbR/CyaY-like superfamily)
MAVTDEVHPGDRAAWRAWLAEHHATSRGVWLVFTKKSAGKRELSYDEAVEEALCFGWIDSKPNKIDAERYKLTMSPRKPASAWSKLNKDRVERLVAAGQMTDAGMRPVDYAKRHGGWTALDEVEALVIPEDFQAALNANESANRCFAAFPNSSKKIILSWIQSAKRPGTRRARIEESVRLAAENIRANHWRR